MALERLSNPSLREMSGWAAVTAVDGMTDLAIFEAFCWIMWRVQMKKRLKATVIVLLGLRLVYALPPHAIFIVTTLILQ
ncbi:hypothetical protein LTR81_026480 [Elasticomyces elasticus]